MRSNSEGDASAALEGGCEGAIGECCAKPMLHPSGGVGWSDGTRTEVEVEVAWRGWSMSRAGRED